MADGKKFKRGDKVIFLASSVAGLSGRVVSSDESDDLTVCVITGDDHPSGHSNRGALVAFPESELEAAPGDLPEIQNL